MYAVKEIYYTIQGEGFHTGTPAVFCRFSGCNLWSGLEKDRETAICKFCDTDFWGTDGELGGKYELEELVDTLLGLIPPGQRPFIVFTGGEPALQMDQKLVDGLHQHDAYVTIETNGTKALPHSIDWITVSPKANTEILVNKGDEIKLVFPQIEHSPEDFTHLEFDHFYLQPLEDEQIEKNTYLTMQYCREHAPWKLSLQTHKILGIK